MKRTELRRQPVRTTRRATGPDQLTVETVWERDAGRCARCGQEIAGERGGAWSVHHRRPRRAGGDRRPDVNLPANLVLLHGSGDTDCHGVIESHRAVAYGRGFLLHHNDQPALRAIEHAVHGWCYLTDDGVVSEDPPEVAA